MSEQGSEADIVEQQQEADDPTTPFARRSEPSIPIEVPEADLLEQARNVGPEHADPEAGQFNLVRGEASEADQLDQLREVPFDEDLDR